MTPTRFLQITIPVAALAWGVGFVSASAAETTAPTAVAACVQPNIAQQEEVIGSGYRIQPGDRLEVYVRQESSLQRQVLVLPDGTISLPLLGIVPVFNKTVQDVEASVCTNLVKRNLIQDPNVTIAVQQLGANVFYVIGKVARPGVFQLGYDVDVIRALAVAGGLATFAEEGNIKILRRTPDGSTEFKFDYGRFMKGNDRQANIPLLPGDTIVVP